MEKRKINIEELGDNYETYGRNLSYKFFNQLMQGFFLFRNRKGGIVSGATTFFIVLSFCPSLLLFISLLGFITGDTVQAKTIVLETLNQNMPQMAPWILESITNIIEAQLNASVGNKIVNLAILTYSLLGVVSSLEFGLHTIHNKKTKGGFIIEDIKSFFVGFSLVSFLGALLVITNETLTSALIFKNIPILQEYNYMFKYPLLAVFTSLAFFTLFYKFTAKNEVAIKNALIGALAFVSCFLAGKSFYWVYVNMTKDDMAQTYGNFHTLIIAVMWVYFLVSSFLYGASVSSLHSKNMAHKDVDLSLSGNILPFKFKKDKKYNRAA